MTEQRATYDAGDTPPTCPRCGNPAAGMDLYPARDGQDTIVCRQCGAQFAGIDYPALLAYLYDKRDRQAD